MMRDVQTIQARYFVTTLLFGTDGSQSKDFGK